MSTDFTTSQKNKVLIPPIKDQAVEGNLRSAIFFDRDGVINRALIRRGKPYPPKSSEELEILPETHQALESLKAAGFILVVVTNQPDVARGKTSRQTVEDIHARIRAELPLDSILTCYHDEKDVCTCRKPQPGLLLQAARAYAIDLKSSFMIGDRWRDIEAGQRAGCQTIFIDYQYNERQPENPTWRVNSLIDAAAIILEQVHG